MHFDTKTYQPYKKILLFFSGGLDTSFLLKYFTKEIGADVLTVSFDLGGDKMEISTIEERAKALGASQHFMIDARRTFVRDYCFKAIKANAIFEGAHPLSSSLSRPLMAKLGATLAREHGCAAIMHGSNGWQNNSARFDTAVRVLAPDIEILEPIMEHNISREFEFEYLNKNGIIIDKKEDNLLSSDNNVWGREVEDGVLETMTEEPNNNIYRLTKTIEETPDKPAFVSITFDRGVPTRLNGQELEPFELVEQLNRLGGMHGVGRHDALEDKIIGYKMREIHESPAATILLKAHKDLESIVLPRKTLTIKNNIDQEWIGLACLGLWDHPLRSDLDNFINGVNERVTGTIKVKLFKGNIIIIGRSSPCGLYRENIGTKTFKIFRRSQHPNRNYYDYYAYEAVIASLAK